MCKRKRNKTSLVLAALLLVLAAGIGGCRLVEKRAEVEVRAAERIGILCATEGGNCVESWNGSDIIVYSDRGSTQKFHVDGTTGNIDGEGTLAITGNTDLEGTLSIDGQANAEQLVVQGYSTQSSSLFVLEDSDADEVVTVSGYGNVVISGTTTMTDALTVNNQVSIDGSADEEQLAVQAYAGQTGSIFVLEDGDADEVLTVSGVGNVVISGTTTVTGTLSDADGALTVADNFMVDGQANAEQLVVQGNSAQTTSLVVFEDSDADEVFTVSAYGNVVISGTVTLTETLTVNNNVSIDGSADEEHLAVQAYASQTSSMFVLEDGDADEVFTVSGIGNIVISGTATITDALTVNNQVSIDGSASEEQLVVQGFSTQSTSVFVLEDSDADEVFTVSAYGNVVISGTTTMTESLTVNNNVSIVASADEELLVVQAEAGQTGSMFVLEDADADEVLTVSGVGNTVSVGTWQIFKPQTVLDVTSNEYTITCLGTYCRLTAGATRYLSDITGAQPEGTVVILTNMGANVINITDTGILSLSGNIALGQSDTLTLISDGTGWCEISTSDN